MRRLVFRRHPVSDEDLSAYLDGRLPARARERVDAHLQACTDCSRKLEEMRLLVAEMRSLPEAKAPRSFALSPELAAATRRAGDRARQAKRATARRAYLGLSGATAAAAVLLIAVLGIELAPSLGGTGGPASTTTSNREATGVTAPQGSGEAEKSLSGGEGQDNVAPGVAPPLPSAVATDRDFSANATPSPASTPYGAAAAAPQQARPVTEESSHLWLWIVEGAAGGLIVGFGASAFWMRRRWIQIDRN